RRAAHARPRPPPYRRHRQTHRRMSGPAPRPRWLLNVVLVGASLVFVLAVLEVATRLFLPVADIPWHDPDNTLGYRLAPRQSGRGGLEGPTAPFRINEAGYNNEHDYDAPRTQGVSRLAVLGDSYVEGLYVDRGTRFFDVLEDRLRRAGRPAEVWSFGVS